MPVPYDGRPLKPPAPYSLTIFLLTSRTTGVIDCWAGSRATQATRAAEEAVHLAKGEKTGADATVKNGKIMVPAVLLKPVLVTKNNIKDTVVKDGFQALKDVNLGLPPDKQIK